MRTIRRRVAGGVDGLALRLARARAEGQKVKVGLPIGSGTHGPSGLPVVQLGAIHEFGSEDGNIPERSFLRSTMDAKAPQHNALIRKLGRAITLGREDPRDALEQLGAVAAGNVQETIADGVPPPLKPATIRRRRRGGSTPLNDTGALKQAITWQVFRDRKGR